MKKEDITFIFTGHNIKWFMVIAAESLIYNSQIDRSQILIFDDESTDGTREEFERRGMKVITWDKETYNAFHKLDNALKLHPSIRVSMLLTSAWKQAEGKYLCFLDGDTAYYDDFVGRLLEMINKYGSEEDLLFGIKRKYEPTLGKFEIMHQYFNYNVYQRTMLCDKERLGKYRVCGENIKTMKMLYDEFETDFIKWYETFTILYNELHEKNVPHTLIPYKGKEYQNLMEKTEHLSWVSSSMRYSLWNESSDQREYIVDCLETPNFKRLCDVLCVDINVMIDTYLSNYQKSGPY